MYDDFEFSCFRLIVIQLQLRCRQCEIRLSNCKLSFYFIEVMAVDHLRSFRYIIILGSVRSCSLVYCLHVSNVFWFVFVSNFQILKHKISLLEASNAELQQELRRRRVTCENSTQRALDAQVFLWSFNVSFVINVVSSMQYLCSVFDIKFLSLTQGVENIFRSKETNWLWK